MEELLNKLIEKGRVPFDVKGISEYFFESVPVGMYRLCWKKPDYDYNVYSKRELVSKESGLWQFVYENNLIQTEHGCFIDNGERAKNVFYKVDTYDEEGDIIQTGDMEGDKFIGIHEPEYRLIESALCNEEDLEKFLLENIKIS